MILQQNFNPEIYGLINRVLIGLITLGLAIISWLAKTLYASLMKEIKDLRDAKHKHANLLTQHDMRIGFIEHQLDIEHKE